MLRTMLSRRQWIGSVGVGCAAATWPGLASATLARAISLPQLVGLSQYALVGTATDANSRWEMLGKAKRIVTYVRLEVEQPIDGRPPPDTSLMLRTLGGRVGDIGQLVHGEVRFELGARSVVFLTPDSDGVLAVTAMAQGHYPLLADASEAVLRLQPSPNMPELVSIQGSAVQRLAQRTVFEAEQLVSDVMRTP